MSSIYLVLADIIQKGFFLVAFPSTLPPPIFAGHMKKRLYGGHISGFMCYNSLLYNVSDEIFPIAFMLSTF